LPLASTPSKGATWVIYEISYGLPAGGKLLGDKAFNDLTAERLLEQDQVRLVPIRKKNMKRQHDWADEYDLRATRHLIEGLNSQSESMGLQRLRARTNEGFFLKVRASLLALFFTRWFAAAN
jgi:hypothetical protein